MSSSTTPLDDLLLTKKAELQKKREQELQHLETWKQTRKPEHLEPLLKAYEPLIAQKLRLYKAPSIPDAAMRAELQKHLIKSFETFKPDRGAQLPTWVNHNLQKAQRYNTRYQNTGYIPEGQTRLIGPIQRAQNELQEQFGREATADELGDHLGMPPKKITKILSSMRKDIPASAFETDPTEMSLQRDHEVLELLPFNLTPDERTVFNHLYGREGHTTISSTNDLANKLGKIPPQF
jgi:DNA-directed RNA polymerase specialized sigma subunit